MRTALFMAIAFLLSNCTKGQPVVGIGGGYTTAKSAVADLQVGFKFNNSLVYYNQLIHLSGKAATPQILGIRYGYNIGSFQPNVGLDYHGFSSDKYTYNKPQQGIHFACGVTKYFKALPLKIDAGLSNRYIIACVGIYKILY